MPTYYNNIYQEIRKFIPDFTSPWAEENLAYLIVNDLYESFLTEYNNPIFKGNFFKFLDDALATKEPSVTELISIQIFEHYLNVEKTKFDAFKEALTPNSLLIFEEYINTAKI
jgi:hypothetical protein